MKLKVTIDGKVYEVEVEVAPERQQMLPTFMVQSAAAALPAGGVSAGAAASANGDEAVDEAQVCRSPISGIVVKSNVRLGQR
jgi:methylmalonyl-CoA carboxyltransferase small subunit